MPVLALGGIRPDNLAQAIAAGARAVAVLGGILEAEDPAAALERYLHACWRVLTPVCGNGENDGLLFADADREQ